MGRLGPHVRLSCHGCQYHSQQRYSVQGDIGWDHYCSEKSAVPEGEDRRDLGGDNSTTPDWCPFRGVALMASLEKENAK